MEKRVKIPMVTDIQEALTMYYEKIELTTADVMSLFGCSRSKATKLKNLAKEKQIEDEVMTWDSARVNTATAYAAWGICIDDMENRWNKLRKLKVTK